MKNKSDEPKIRIHPLRDRVLLKPIEKEEKSASGIFIPDTVSKEKPEQGKVVAVGEGRVDENGKLILPKVKVGDTVIFSKYGYDDIKVEETEYYILKEENILAIIK